MVFLRSLLAFCCLISVVHSQGTFANTKFDLSQDLPVEEIPIQEKPQQIKNEPKKPAAPTPTPVPLPPAPTTPPPPSPSPPPPAPVQQPSILPPPAPVPQTSILPPPPPVPLAPLSPHPAFVPPPPPPQLPPPVQPLSPVSQFGNPVLHPQFPQPGAATAPVVILPPQNTIPLQGTKNILLVPANLHRERAELWFTDNFDFSWCIQNVDIIADKFLNKFPRNLLKNKKEIVLTELLTSRLRECAQKQYNNQWGEVDRLLPTLNLAPSEESECRSGLVQEQISCINVQSYSCQFVQPQFAFRLVPTRIIVQEARLAEDGAEKCRKHIKQLKRQNLIH